MLNITHNSMVVFYCIAWCTQILLYNFNYFYVFKSYIIFKTDIYDYSENQCLISAWNFPAQHERFIWKLCTNFAN